MRYTILGLIISGITASICAMPSEFSTTTAATITTAEKAPKVITSATFEPKGAEKQTSNLTTPISTEPITLTTVVPNKESTTLPSLQKNLTENPQQTKTTPGSKPSSQEATTAKSSVTTTQKAKSEENETKYITTAPSKQTSTTSSTISAGTTAKPLPNCCGKSNESTTPKNSPNELIDEGKIVIFNGICGSDGCKIKGDVYDALPAYFIK